MFARRTDQHVLVIAAQTDEPIRPFRLSPDQEVHHLPTVGPSVDVIAKTDEPGALTSASALARRQQRLQLVETPVDVADGECKYMRQTSPRIRVKY